MGTRMSALQRGLRDKPQASCEGGLGSDGQPASANQIRQAVRTHTHTHTHTHKTTLQFTVPIVVLWTESQLDKHPRLLSGSGQKSRVGGVRRR